MSEHNRDKTVSGDMELLERYYRDEYSDMLSFASYLLSSRSLGEVAVQETFVIALGSIDKLKASPKPVGWLYNTLKYVVKHMKRDVNKTINNVMSLEDVPESASDSFEDEAYISLLDAEDGEDMKLLTRFYVQGWSLKELSNTYGVSVGAIKMRIKRAKGRLKEKLK